MLDYTSEVTPAKNMRICILTSYPPSVDGVSTYSAKLCAAMLSLSNDLEILVVSNEYSDLRVNPRLKVVKGWKRGSFLYPLKTLRIVIAWRPELVHCQHEYWLYGRSVYSITFPMLLFGLRMLSKPILVTMHHVVPNSYPKAQHYRLNRYRMNGSESTSDNAAAIVLVSLLGA